MAGVQLSARVCVRVHVRACVRACACVRVRVRALLAGKGAEDRGRGGEMSRAFLCRSPPNLQEAKLEKPPNNSLSKTHATRSL